MKKGTARSNAIDEYIAGFPNATQRLLKKLRAAIIESAPDAEETISYGMPAYKCEGTLVYFAAYESHIGFYPTPSALVAFKKRLSGFECSKGAVRFPIGQALPLELVSEMVAFRVKENRDRAAVKSGRKKRAGKSLRK